jgi:hypothetical protein
MSPERCRNVQHTAMVMKRYFIGIYVACPSDAGMMLIGPIVSSSSLL